MQRSPSSILVTILAAALLCFAFIPAAHAITNPDEKMADPALNARAEQIEEQIRCVVCQSQSILDSESEIAQGLRTYIRTQLESGKTNEEIINNIHTKYGDFVLMKPPVKPKTWLLWFGPALVFAFGFFLMRSQFMPARRSASKEASKKDKGSAA